MSDGALFPSSSPLRSVVFLMIAILTAVRWYLTVLLVCISLIRDVSLLSVCLLWKMSVLILCPFFLRFLWYWVVCTPYSLGVNHLLVTSFANISSHSVGYLFVDYFLFLGVWRYIYYQKSRVIIYNFLSLNSSNILIFYTICNHFEVNRGGLGVGKERWTFELFPKPHFWFCRDQFVNYGQFLISLKNWMAAWSYQGPDPSNYMKKIFNYEGNQSKDVASKRPTLGQRTCTD